MRRGPSFSFLFLFNLSLAGWGNEEIENEKENE